MNKPNCFTLKLIPKGCKETEHVHTIWIPSFIIVHLQKYPINKMFQYIKLGINQNIASWFSTD